MTTDDELDQSELGAELDALKEICDALCPLSHDGRRRVIAAACIALGFEEVAGHFMKGVIVG